MSEPKRSWWGLAQIPEGQGGMWRVGPLSLLVQRSAHEWRVAYRNRRDPLEREQEVRVPVHVSDPPEGWEVVRFGTTGGNGSLRLTPVVPDRSVVVRPDMKITVTAGQAITLYTSVPMFVRVEAGSPPSTLLEVPTFRMSDTWFGPDTTEGQLCYALTISGRTVLEDLPRRPHRAVCVVEIRNRTDFPLELDRIRLPMPACKLFVDEDGTLWTDRLELSREGPTATEVRVLRHKSASWELVSPERVPPNVFVRALEAMFARSLG